MDTIAAIATSPGLGGIGIIRISGEKAFELILKIFKSKKIKNIEDIKANTINYGFIKDNGNIVDEVLVSFFKAPHSYTAEDVVEINTHGGVIVMNKILEVVLKNGARLAENGEFTKRAFINGRIDLTKVEAISSILNAKSEMELSISQKMLNGKLNDIVQNLKKDLLNVLMNLEVAIDYPEYDTPEISKKEIVDILKKIEKKLKAFSKNFDIGRKINEGISVALVGEPNAGKSSLLNIMLNKERSIVTDIEGTTRDTIEENILIDGVSIKIIDTAGIRETKEKIEKIGIDRTIQAAKDSNILIMLIDSTKKDIDISCLNSILTTQNKRVIFVLNKIDTIKSVSQEENKNIILKKIKEYIKESKNEGNLRNKKENICFDILEISCAKKIGIDAIYEILRKYVDKLKKEIDTSDYIIIHQRQKNIISEVLKETNVLFEELKNNIPIDIISTRIREILDKINELTGENSTDEVLNKIFSNFCLGK